MTARLFRALTTPRFGAIGIGVAFVFVLITSASLVGLQTMRAWLMLAPYTAWDVMILFSHVPSVAWVALSPLGRIFFVVQCCMVYLLAVVIAERFSQHRALWRATEIGFGGMILSIIGAGCAVCGTPIAVAILGATASFGAHAWLPFLGTILNIGSISLLGFALWRALAQKQVICRRY